MFLKNHGDSAAQPGLRLGTGRHNPRDRMGEGAAFHGLGHDRPDFVPDPGDFPDND